VGNLCWIGVVCPEPMVRINCESLPCRVPHPGPLLQVGEEIWAAFGDCFAILSSSFGSDEWVVGAPFIQQPTMLDGVDVSEKRVITCAVVVEKELSGSEVWVDMGC